MAHPFKVGDIVIWNQENGGGFTKGKEYVVERAIVGVDHQNYIDVTDDNGKKRTRYAYRFKLKEVEMGGWQCVNADGVRLVEGRVYHPKGERELSILINGSWYRKERFIRTGAVPVAPVEEKKKEQWELLLEKLKEKVDKEHVGTCSYAMIDTQVVERFQVGDVCHARMVNQYEKHVHYNVVVLNVSGHLKEHLYKDEYKSFVDWIVQRSPWKDAFINIPTEKVLESGIAIDTTKGVNYCVSAAVALRTGSEYPQIVKAFKELVDLGCDEWVAYIVSNLMKNGSYDCEHGYHGGHNVISSNMRPARLRDFVKGVRHNDGEPLNAANRFQILKTIDESMGEDSLYGLLGTCPLAKVEVTRWDARKAIKPHPVAGLAPFAFYMTRLIYGN